LNGTFAIKNHPSLKSLDISANNIATLILQNNSRLEKVQADLNRIKRVDIAGNPVLSFLNLDSNLIQELPPFLDGTDTQPLSTVSLSSNRISGTLPTWSFNPRLMDLDLSRNLISDDSANLPKIRFWSEAIAEPETEAECYLNPALYIPDPDRRVINLVGNRFNASLLQIYELGNFQERFLACRNAVDLEGDLDDVITSTNVFPQGCKEKGHYLTPGLYCQSCYSDWVTKATQDVEKWGQVLANVGLPTTSPFHQKTYLSCSKCDGGVRRRTRELNPNRQCEDTDLSIAEKDICSFPCRGKTPLSVQNQLPTLLGELSKPLSFWDENLKPFLPLLVKARFPFKNLSIVMPTKQEYSTEGEMDIYVLKIEVLNCFETKTFLNLINLTYAVCNSILEGIDLRILHNPFSEISIEVRSCPKKFFPSSKDSRRCDSCYGEWETISEYFDGDGWEKTLSSLSFIKPEIIREIGAETFGTCSSCSNGKRTRVKQIVDSQKCPGLKDEVEPVSCNYPCRTEYDLNLQDSFNHLLRELRHETQEGQNSTFLQVLIQTIWPNVTISIPEESTPADFNAFMQFFNPVRKSNSP